MDDHSCKIHIWDFPPVSTYLLLEESLRRTLVGDAISAKGSMSRLAILLNSSAQKYGIRTSYGAGNICDWKLGRLVKDKRRQAWAPLWVLLELLNFLSVSNEDHTLRLRLLEKSVRAYKEWESGTPIFSPKLPIDVTPEFDSIVFHLMGDGCWGGKGKSASYRQKNKEGRENFIKKLSNVFGTFEINRYETEKEWKVCIPSIFVRVIEKYYSLKTPSSKKRIPPQTLKKCGLFKLAGLLAFMVDEAHVGDSIEIYASNKSLLEDLRSICGELGYSCAKVELKARAGHCKHKLNHYRLRFHLSAVEKLLRDIQAISKTFPTCTLVQKQKSLELLAKRRSLKRGKGKDNATKRMILKELFDGPKTTNYFKEAFLIGGQTIREHLIDLENKSLIERGERIGNSDLWFLVQKSESRV